MKYMAGDTVSVYKGSSVNSYICNDDEQHCILNGPNEWS